MVRRRRVDHFAQLLDEATGGGQQFSGQPIDDEMATALRLGMRLTQVPLPGPSDDQYRSCLRAMLLATADSDGIGATSSDPPAAPTGPAPCDRPRVSSGRCTRLRCHNVRCTHRTPRVRRLVFHRRHARAVLVVGLAAGTIALSGISAASGDAVPGDALYRMKRSTERAQLALAPTDISRGQLYLSFARIRLSEAVIVRSDSSGFIEALADMDAETRAGVHALTTAATGGHNPAALDAIDIFLIRQRHALTDLLIDLPTATRPRALSSARLLDDVARRSWFLRGALRCGHPTTGAPADELGPLPRRCPGQWTDRRPTDPSDLRSPAPTAPSTPATPPAGRAGSPSAVTPPGSWEAAVPVPVLPLPSQAQRSGADRRTKSVAPPTSGDPVGVKPVSPDPVALDPVALDPVALDPIGSDPVVTEPAVPPPTPVPITPLPAAPLPVAPAPVLPPPSSTLPDDPPGKER